MGTTYLFVNVDKREYIDPGALNYGPNKDSFLMNPSGAAVRLASYLMVYDWHGDRVGWLGDIGGALWGVDTDVIQIDFPSDWRDITETVVHRWNERYSNDPGLRIEVTSHPRHVP